MAVLTGVISYLSTEALKKSVRHGLLAIADAKTNQLGIYVRERRADLTMASRTPSLVNAIENLNAVRSKDAIDSPTYLEQVRKVRPALRISRKHLDTTIILFSPQMGPSCSGSQPSPIQARIY